MTAFQKLCQKLEHRKYRLKSSSREKTPDPFGPALSRELDKITSSHPLQTQLFYDSNKPVSTQISPG